MKAILLSCTEDYVLSWSVDGEAAIDTFFTIEVSDNKGRTWATLVAASAPSFYLPAKKRFGYQDETGTSGRLYRVSVDGGGAAITSVPPTVPTCEVYGYLTDSLGRPVNANGAVLVELARVKGNRRAEAEGVPALRAGTVDLAQPVPVPVHTDESGFWRVSVAQGAVVRFVVAGTARVVRVPRTTGPVFLGDLDEVRGGDLYGLWPENRGSLRNDY